MKEYIDLLSKNPLFKGMTRGIWFSADCLSAKTKTYYKDEPIFEAGSRPEYVGTVLSGSAFVLQEDYWGNRNILSNIGVGGIFGESFSCAEAAALPVSVIAKEDSVILLINVKKILNICSTACATLRS